MKGRLLICALLALLLSLGFAGARGLSFDSQSIALNVGDDGAIRSSIAYSMYVPADTHLISLDLPDSAAQYSDIAATGAAPGKQAGVPFELLTQATGRRIQLDLGGFNGDTELRLSFTVRNAITCHADACDFSFPVWNEKAQTGVGPSTATVTFPRELPSSTIVYAHPPASLAYKFDGSSVGFTSPGVAIHDFSNFRIVFPREVLAGASLSVSPGSGFAIAQGQENLENSIFQYSQFVWAWPLIVLLLLVLGFVLFYRLFGRHAVLDVKESSQAPSQPPWEAEFIARSEVTMRSLTATLLDLARQGHLKIEPIYPETKFDGAGIAAQPPSEEGRQASQAPAHAPIDFLLTRSKGSGELDPLEHWLFAEIFKKRKAGWFSVGTQECYAIKVSEVEDAHCRDDKPLWTQWANAVSERIESQSTNTYLDRTGKKLFYSLQLALALATLAINMYLPSAGLLSIESLFPVLVLVPLAVVVLAASNYFRERRRRSRAIISQFSVVSSLLMGIIVLLFYHMNFALLVAYSVILLSSAGESRHRFLLSRLTPLGRDRFASILGYAKHLDSQSRQGDAHLDDATAQRAVVYHALIGLGHKERLPASIAGGISPESGLGFVRQPGALEAFERRMAQASSGMD